VAVPATHLEPGQVPRWTAGAFAVPDTYVAALRRAGVRPVVLDTAEPGPAEEVLAPFEGLLLIGGGDVDPFRYGAEPSATVYGVEPARDGLELRLVLEARRRGLPTMAVCRGMQVLNVAFGGALLQDLPAEGRFGPHGPMVPGGTVAHDVKVAPGSRLAGCVGGAAVIPSCPSQHHQGVSWLGEGLVPTAWSDDGLIEAVEAEPGDGWLLGVQWHPERTAADDPVQQALYDGFGAAVLGR
jgi:gamma-glutamyl-gamma-aminobutyrate hydrolase PuuD